MSTSVSGLSTNFFPSAENGFSTTTSGSVSSGATTVGLASVAGYSNGEVAVFVIDPTDLSKKQTFTGVIDTAGVQVTDVVWTAGTNQTHALGATVVDYATATHISMMTKGILTHADQDGTLKAGAVDNTAVLADGIVTKAKLATAVTDSLDQGWAVSYSGTTTPAPNTVTCNGNRSYSLVFNGVDLTNYLSPGMRLKTTRTVTAPTQCTDLESGSSQGWSKTDATGLATGTTWTWKGKIKPESYTLGVIAAVDDGTNRMEIRQLATGQIEIAGGTTAAEDLVTSYQSVALSKWQDVTASITIGTPTGEIRIDDVVVPSFVTASAATTMTISGDEEIYVGRDAAGRYYDGKIAQVALFNAVISDATLKTYSSQTMTGAETSCEGFWSFNGNGNDSSANANNLTALNSATATNADSPFSINSFGTATGTTDYGIITAATFSTNTTLTVQVPEGNTIPTTGGVSAVAYSTQKAPYGMPSGSSKWRIAHPHRTNDAVTSNATYGSFQSGGWAMTVPVGDWNVGVKSGGIFSNATTVANYGFSPTALTGLAITAYPDISFRALSAAASPYTLFVDANTRVNLTSPATYVMYTLGATTGSSLDGTVAAQETYADFNLL